MNHRIVISFLFFMGVLASCSNLIIPEIENNKSEITKPTYEAYEPIISYDVSREIVVFIDENNNSIDIKSFDETSDKIVKCINPIDIVILQNTSSELSSLGGSFVRAIIIGVIEDEQPGIWLIDNDGTVNSPFSERSGKRTSVLDVANVDDQSLIGNGREAFLGWVYKPTLISDDGLIITGYAYNEDGFSKSFINIEPGSKAAVYWRLKMNPGGAHFISSAKLIGTFTEKVKVEGRLYKWLQHIISKLKILFLDHLDDYLKEPESVEVIDDTSLYLISGPNKDDISAVATIDFRKVYTIEVETPSNQEPIATFADAAYMVVGGGSSEVNGLYKQNGTTGNILDGPYFQKVSDSLYSIYQFANSTYEAAWAIHSNVVDDFSDQETVLYYIGSPASLPPVSGWVAGVGSNPVPEVYNYPVHVDNSSGFTVTAYYEFYDPDGDQEGSTIFAWYSSENGQTGWILEEEGSNNSFITDSDLGFIKVIITPVDSIGAVGDSIESSSVDLSSS